MQSYPFHMTAENLAKLRLDPNMPFWRELKKGSDYFDVTKLETPVGVCNKKYVFGATPKSGRFDALSPCPPLTEDEEVKSAVAAKAAADERDVAELVGKGVKPVRIMYADGGQNESFKAERLTEVSRPDALAAGPSEIALDDSPKSKPVAVQIAAAKARMKSSPVNETKVAAAAPAAAAPSPDVPATFAAAPSAYASEEPKAGTMGMIKNWFGLKNPEASPAAPAVDTQPSAPVATQLAQATPAPERKTSTKRQIAKAPVKPAAVPVQKPEQVSSALPAEIAGPKPASSWLSNLMAFSPVN
jgi:hypothetical protein